jgi:hypothetical protein
MAAGASVSGFVRTEDGKACDGARVEVTSLDGHRLLASQDLKRFDASDAERYPFTAVTDARGFFQVVSVPAGEYGLAASDSKGGVGRSTVSIGPDAETRLSDALELSPPVSVRVSVAPAHPHGTPWTVALEADSASGAMVELVNQTGDDGSTLFKAVPEGAYRVVVRDQVQRWFSQAIQVEAHSQPILVELPLLELRGSVRLGNEPLAARLTFRGLGLARISFESDSLGLFQGFLPRAGTWTVDVEASDLGVSRSMRNIEVVRESEMHASVELDLPDTRLEVDVVTERGGSVRDATVAVVSVGGGASDRPFQAFPGHDGRFVLRGLPLGDVVVWAEGTQGGESDRTSLRIVEGSRHQVRLVLRDAARTVGRIVSAKTGAPIAGAFAFVVPSQVPLAGATLERSDSTGRFEIRIPHGTREVNALFGAPGKAVTMAKVPVVTVNDGPSGEAEPSFQLVLDASGGRITLDFDAPVNLGDASAGTIAVFHAAVPELLSNMVGLPGSGEITADGRQIRLSRVETGHYRFCAMSLTEYVSGSSVPENRCAQGVVVADGDLRLSLPAPVSVQAR